MPSINDFIIEAEIGRGGFGTVFLASKKIPDKNENENSNKDKVALKIIRKSQLTNEELRTRVAAEVQIQSRLQNQSIVSLLEFFEDDKNVYLVMEFCPNGDLYSYLIERKNILERTNFTQTFNPPELAVLPEAEIRGLMLQLGRGVRYLHKHGVLHRDLKLKNLVLSHDMEIKIADFGLATTISSNGSDPTTFCGTPNYISPEVAARKPYGFATDLWALGCLLVTFMRGSPPAEDEILADPGLWLTSFKTNTREAIDLAQRLLIKDPAKRLSINQYFSHPFFNPIHPSKPLQKLSDYGLQHYSNLETPQKNLPPPSLPPPFPLPEQIKQKVDFNNAKRLNRPFSLKASGPVKYESSNQPNHSTQLKSFLSAAMLNVLGYNNSISNPSQDKNQNQSRNQNQNQSSQKLELDRKALHNTNNDENSPSFFIEAGRLHPIKQKTKHATLEITQDHKIKVDFVKDSYTMVFDSSIHKILLFSPGTTILDPNKAIGAYSFSDPNLNSELLRKTKYVLKFVDLVKSKTPKIILRTSQAKAIYMENSPNADLQVTFYNEIRVLYSRKKLVVEVRIPSKSDLPTDIQRFPLYQNTLSKNEPTFQIKLDSIPTRLLPIINHVDTCLKTCISTDNCITAWENGTNPNASDYTGQISYPVSVREDTDLSSFIPEGLSKKILIQKKSLPLLHNEHNPTYSYLPTESGNLNFATSSGYFQKSKSATVVSTLRPPESYNKYYNQFTTSADQNHGNNQHYQDHNLSGVKLNPNINNRQIPSHTKVEPRNDSLNRNSDRFSQSQKFDAIDNFENSASDSKHPTSSLETLDSTKFSFIPGLGWCICSKSEDKEIADRYIFNVLFVDGSKILVDSQSDHVVFWEYSHHPRSSYSYEQPLIFPIDYTIPENIKQKLKCIPQFLPLLGLDRIQ